MYKLFIQVSFKPDKVGHTASTYIFYWRNYHLPFARLFPNHFIIFQSTQSLILPPTLPSTAHHLFGSESFKLGHSALDNSVFVVCFVPATTNLKFPLQASSGHCTSHSFFIVQKSPPSLTYSKFNITSMTHTLSETATKNFEELVTTCSLRNFLHLTISCIFQVPSQMTSLPYSTKLAYCSLMVSSWTSYQQLIVREL